MTVMAEKTKDQRGPAGEVLAKIAGVLGLTIEDVEADYYKVHDAVCALAQAKKVEDIVAGADAAPAEGMSTAARGARAVEGIAPDKVEDALSSLIAWGQDVLGKPEAPASEVLDELVARKEEIAAALGADTPPPEGEGESVEAAAEEKPEAEEQEEPEEKRTARERATAVSAERDALRAKVTRYETTEWIDGELAKRKIALKPEARSALIEDAIRHGRDVALKIINAHNAPPRSHPLDESGAPAAAAPTSFRAAVDACMRDARAELEIENASAAALPHYVRARAQQLALKRWPELKSNPAAGDGAAPAA